MKKLSIVLIVLVASMNLFANDNMCETYAKFMKGDESLPVKIGECNRILYEECEYSLNKEKCIEKIHYSNSEELFSLL